MHIINIILFIFILVLFPVSIYLRPRAKKNNWNWLSNIEKKAKIRNETEINILIEELERINTNECHQIIDLIATDSLKDKQTAINILSKNDEQGNKLALYIILGFFESKEIKKFRLSKRKGYLLRFLNSILLAVIVVLLVIWYLDASGTFLAISSLMNNILIK